MPNPKKKNKAPKSHKADGTPKKRWTSEQRAEAGHGPRKRGGRDRFDRDDRAPRSYDRDERGPRTSDRDDRGPRQWDRADRPRKYDRDDRGPRQWDRADRPRKFDRDDRGPRKFDRDDRGPRTFDRDDRGPRQWDRGDRPRKFDRDDRGPRTFDRDDRGPRTFDRDDRGPRQWDRGDRPRKFDRDDRGPRTFDRNDRGPRQWDRADRDDRGERRRGWGRDEFRNETWGSDEQPGRRPAPRSDRFSERPRPHRHHDRDRDHGEHAAEDTMSWTEAEAMDLDLDSVDSSAGFGELGVPTALVAALASQGITDPFPIQTATIPDALSGRDVLGRGRTGSGKTLAFGLPLVSRLADAPSTGGAPRAMILTPTRELALQIADNLSPLARAMGLDLTLIAGGMSYGPQLRAFERGVDIVVATPGRLIDLLERGAVDLSQVMVTVLDEADHMADLGFMPAVTTLLDAVAPEGQRMLFSATLDHAVDRLVKKYLSDPVTHEVDPETASVSTMVHRLLHVRPHEKNAVTAEIANREGRTVVFVRTQMAADRVAGQLREVGVMAGPLHGGLTQGARARMLGAFKDGSVPVLVATDVAARGIHVDDVSLVLQADPPRDSKDYLHRAGRTARAGTSGVVATIVLPHQRKTMRRIAGQAGVKSTPVDVAPGTNELRDATGARIFSGAPIAEDDFQALIAPKQQPRRGGPRGGGRRYGGQRRGGYNRRQY